jgi:hypothetical protein
MFCISSADSAGHGRGRIALPGFLALAALIASGSGVYAQQQDSILKQAAKIFGFATDVGPPADFVTKTRPTGDLDYIPVFQAPPEPPRPALKSGELKAVKSDLDGVEKQHDAMRQAYPPAAKAMADEQAAQKKKSSNAPAARQ